MGRGRSIAGVAVGVAAAMVCVKLLLTPTYHSTDFDVHRSWLALTHTQHPSTWYTDAVSQWTLDYPPLFAWFEYVLALPLAHIHPPLVAHVDDPSAAALLAAHPEAKPIHRATVIAADLLLLIGAAYTIYGLWNPFTPPDAVLFSPASVPNMAAFPDAPPDVLAAPHRRSPQVVVAEDQAGVRGGLSGVMGAEAVSLVLVLCSPALLLLDHVHFQYNGMLTGVLLLAIGGVTSRSGYTLTAFAFAVLVGLKHLYVVLAPVFTVFLFKAVVVLPSGRPSVCGLGLSFSRFFLLAAIVAAVLAATFGPFIAWGAGPAMLARLFPFKRGLVHAYWAPNVWALYAGAEVLAGGEGAAGLTSGVVGAGSFSVLPTITPAHTAALSALFVAISAGKVWLTTPASSLVRTLRGQSARNMRYLQRPAVVFIHAVVESSLAVFLFGWHVHEKALLVPLIPLALLAPTSPRYAGMFAFLQAVAHVALFPLFPPGLLTPVKITLALAYAAFVWYALAPALPRLYSAYLLGLFPVVALSLAAPLLLPALPFLPAMAISLYTAVGAILAYAWILLY